MHRAARPLIALALLAGLAGCAASPAAAPNDAVDEKATRSVEHARGTAEVPAEPQRVVVLEPVQLDTAVALGITPVGAAVLNEAAGVPAYLGVDGVESVGTVMEPSIEAIAALEPDLIIGTESRHAALYERLGTIAPTVFMATQTDPWQQNVALVAEALGDPEGAEQLLADYQERCDEIADGFGTAGSTAQLVRPRDGVLTLYGPESFAGSALECAGFTIPEQPWEDISLDVSPENVLDASADLVLVTTTDVDDESTLPSVIAENASYFPEPHLVDQSFWITGVGPLGGMAVLDDLERILAS